jgi:DNA-binding SARP family transcriptional activator
MSGVDYRILGSLEAVRDGRELTLGGAKQRALLAILLLGANRVVTTDQLVESLWPDTPPGKPQTAIQGYVSQLRKTLDPERPFEIIRTEPAGYRLPGGAPPPDL